MTRRVAIVGVGYTTPRPVTPDVSYRELIYDAAVRAYDDAGISPKDVDAFTTCAEDFTEGTSIFDEYTPDQLGAAQKPVHTITGDGIHGLLAAWMQVRTGLLDVVVVEAHSKASNLLTKDHVLHYAMDPVYNRPLGYSPQAIAGMEMQRWLHESGTTLEECAHVVVKNRANALQNPNGAHAAQISIQDVLRSERTFDPLTHLQAASFSDGSVVLVLASEERARRMKGQPIWVAGGGWCNDTPWIENREWGRAVYAEKSAKMAYKQAGIKNPAREIDVFEIDDSYAFKELQHMEALELCRRGEAGRLARLGETDRGSEMPVNVSGGSLGMGLALDAAGAYRVVEIALQLRGEAGRRQVEGARRGLAMAWRGVPSASGAVVVLEN